MSTLKASYGGTSDVKNMYEHFPFPSPDGSFVTHSLRKKFENLLPGQDLAGKRILDAGCGTAAPLGPMAAAYPKASFVGIDLTTASLAGAAKLVESMNLANVTLKQANILTFETADRFDFVVSNGVIHHLEDPLSGMKNLKRCLAPDGTMLLWFYDSIGEFDRLCDRELLFSLWGANRDLPEGMSLMKDLGFDIDYRRYGGNAMRTGHFNWESINADGFMHEIVNAYRFHEAIEMFRACGFDWVAVDTIMMWERYAHLDLDEVADRADGQDYIVAKDVFGSEHVLARYQELSVSEKLKVLELKLKPTGFHVLGGNGDSFEQFGPRLKGNLVDLRGR